MKSYFCSVTFLFYLVSGVRIAQGNELRTIKVGEATPSTEPGKMWKIIGMSDGGLELQLENIEMTAQEAANDFKRLRIGGILPRSDNEIRFIFDIADSSKTAGFSDVVFAINHGEKDLRLVFEQRFFLPIMSEIAVGSIVTVSAKIELPKLPDGYSFNELNAQGFYDHDFFRFELVKMEERMPDILKFASGLNIWAENYGQANSLKETIVSEKRTFLMWPPSYNDIRFIGRLDFLGIGLIWSEAPSTYSLAKSISCKDLF